MQTHTLIIRYGDYVQSLTFSTLLALITSLDYWKNQEAFHQEIAHMTVEVVGRRSYLTITLASAKDAPNGD